MGLPSPIPDNPLRWDGWRNYNSTDPYERLCLDFDANPTDEDIEHHCRELLVWWQKKLPLKNQPSNPMAQLLRGGMDEAPARLAEARTRLLDPAQRNEVDSKLRSAMRDKALVEFYKLFEFATASGTLSEEGEENLMQAGRSHGLTDDDIHQVIDVELVLRGVKRKSAEPPPPPPAPIPALSSNGTAAAVTGNDPSAEFRRLLRMSKLEDGMMTDDQRDAMCNIGESLGLTGGEAEDLIDEYLDEMEGLPPLPMAAPKPSAPTTRVLPASSPARGMTMTAAATEVSRELVGFDCTPLRRAEERQRFPNFKSLVGVEMILVPSGVFMLGSDSPEALPNERPVSRVGVRCFHISRTPITNAEYEKFDPEHRRKRCPWADDQHPVVYVSAHDATKFCEWLSAREKKKYRLPTEAEWEYAARGTENRKFPWGDQFTGGDLANFADARTRFTWREAQIDDGYAETSPVGHYPRGASPFGLLDMAGNVWEWCFDYFGPYINRERLNPRGPSKGAQRVYRGGSWKSRIASVRTSSRGFNVPSYSANDIGFRIVCECEG